MISKHSKVSAVKLVHGFTRDIQNVNCNLCLWLYSIPNMLVVSWRAELTGTHDWWNERWIWSYFPLLNDDQWKHWWQPLRNWLLYLKQKVDNFFFIEHLINVLIWSTLLLWRHMARTKRNSTLQIWALYDNRHRIHTCIVYLWRYEIWLPTVHHNLVINVTKNVLW